MTWGLFHILMKISGEFNALTRYMRFLNAIILNVYVLGRAAFRKN